MSKRWKIILLNQIKSNCKNLDNTLITIAHWDTLDNTINFIDGINNKNINDFLNEVSLFSPILEPKKKNLRIN